MELIIGALILGFLLGKILNPSQSIQSLVGKVSSFSVLLLLFTMGITIGANREIITNLPSLGLNALIIAIGAVAMSVLAVWAIVKLVKIRGEGCD